MFLLSQKPHEGIGCAELSASWRIGSCGSGVMEAIEDFDALYQEALSRRSSDDLWDAFVQEVIGLLPYANPLNNRETLEGEMLEQLLIKTREVLLNPSGN